MAIVLSGARAILKNIIMAGSLVFIGLACRSASGGMEPPRSRRRRWRQSSGRPADRPIDPGRQLLKRTPVCETFAHRRPSVCLPVRPPVRTPASIHTTS